MTTRFTEEDIDAKLKENPDLAKVNRKGNPAVTIIDWLGIEPSEKLSRKFKKLREAVGISKGNKYHAVRAEYNGRRYPSKHQATDAEIFYTQLQHGLIKGVLEEVPFRLPGLTRQGRPIIHRVDFGILELDGTTQWYESKGKELELGRLKRVQVEQLYKIKITVI